MIERQRQRELNFRAKDYHYPNEVTYGSEFVHLHRTNKSEKLQEAKKVAQSALTAALKADRQAYLRKAEGHVIYSDEITILLRNNADESIRNRVLGPHRNGQIENTPIPTFRPAQAKRAIDRISSRRERIDYSDEELGEITAKKRQIMSQRKTGLHTAMTDLQGSVVSYTTRRNVK